MLREVVSSLKVSYLVLLLFFIPYLFFIVGAYDKSLFKMSKHVAYFISIFRVTTSV